MRSARFLGVVAIASVLCGVRAQADPREAARLLAEAEKIRAADKPKSRQLLDAAHRLLSPSSDPHLLAQAQLLECNWSDRPEDAYRAFAAGMRFVEQTKSAVLRAKFMICRANALTYDGKTREAESEYAAALAIARRARDGKVEGQALFGISWLQYERGAMADALTNLQALYRLSTALGDEKLRLDALANMANVYADASVGQFDRAIEYYRQLVDEYAKHGQPNDVADTLFNIGSTFEAKGNFVAAELYYRRALSEFEKLKRPSDIAYTRRALGSALTKQGRGEESLPHLNAALAYYERQRDAGSIAFVKQFRGYAYRRLGRPAEALRDLDAARQYYEGAKNARYLERNTHETALVYEGLGDWRNAYAFRTRNAQLQQELAVSRRDEESSRLRVQFDAEKKEQENRALARENALRSTALREAQRNQKLQFAVIALTALLAIALAVLFWRQVAHTRRMRTMAMTDELTRLPNRRHILAVADVAFEQARRDGHPAAVIVLDIDRFKRINDTYGHAAGDEVLKRVARTCRMTLRPLDQIGRIGGEEFLIVLHQVASTQQAIDIAERLRAAVERLDVSSIAEDLQVTISLGVCVTNDHDPHAAIAAADSVLYRAKESGRNRVEVAAA